jgi:hypothetical protein
MKAFVVGLVLVCFAPAALAQSPRLFQAVVEVTGPLDGVVLEPLRGGYSRIALDVPDGETRTLVLPLPLGDAADLDFAAPAVRPQGAGSAQFVRFEPAPRLAAVPRVLVALTSPSPTSARPRTSLAAGLVALAALVGALAARPARGHVGAQARRRALVSAAIALLGAGAVTWIAAATEVAPAAWRSIDRLAAADGRESPRLVQRFEPGAFEFDEAFRGVVESVPAGADLVVRGRVAPGRADFLATVPGGGVLVREAALPAGGGDDPLAIAAEARRHWRAPDGAWWSVASDGTLSPGRAPRVAFASGGLPTGRSALVALFGTTVWRVVDCPRESAATLD